MSRNTTLVLLLIITGIISVSITVYNTVLLGNFEAVDSAPIEEE